MSTITEVVVPWAAVWTLILAVLWSLGLLPWKPGARVAAWLERWGSFDLDSFASSGTGFLVLVSAVGLFLELLLIRWVSSEIRVFAYFKNLVLIGCFFGFGLGCYRSRHRIQIFNVLLPMLVLTIVTAAPWARMRNFLLDLSGYIAQLSDVHIWSRSFIGGPKSYVLAAVAFSVIIPLLALATIAMIPMGQMVARLLETSKKGISAYSANVFASVLGIWAFTLVCFLSAPPVVWFACAGAALLLLFRQVPRVRVAVAVTFAVTCLMLQAAERNIDYDPTSQHGAVVAAKQLQVEEEHTYWSPYQNLTLSALTNGQDRIRYVLTTNGSWYCEIMNLSPEFVAKYPEYVALPTGGFPLPYFRYNMPYRFVDPPKNVLILGSGMGNDVAAALRNGSERVVAVEIDPLIVKLGTENHPEHPYKDPRVVAVVNDARNYVQNTPERFDLIVSSILDSHTTQSAFTNIRTDNYVYTREGIAHMIRLLKPGGVLSLSFSGERRWFAGRLKNLITDITGKEPLNFQNGNTFFLVGDGIEARLERDAELKSFVAAQTKPVFEDAEPTTDDWPYFYHRERGIPVIVSILSLLVLAACGWALRRGGLEVRNIQWHFFFLGAGFLLMEVQIISRLAVVFGTTWLVNAIAISAVLLLILLANLTAARLPKLPERVAYLGLLVTLAVCYFVPLDALLFDSWWQRAAASTLLVCTPIYFAGIIFIRSFESCRFQAEAMGSNLMGSVLGGLLEALSFWTGLRSLLIVAAAFYLLSMLAKRGLAPAAGAPAPGPATS